LIFGSFLLFFVCIMQGQQVSCKGGERLTDNGHKKPRLLNGGGARRIN
jgi:hypothetical protein